MSETSQPAEAGTVISGSSNVLSSLAAFVSRKEPEAEAPSAEEPLEAEEGAEQGQPEAAEDDTPEPEAPQTYKIKVGGQEIEVSLDELKAGYQKDADYRQKTMALSDERRAAQAQLQQAAQERHQAAQALVENGSILKSQLQQFAQINWPALASQDPAQYVQLQAQYDALKQQWSQLTTHAAELQRVEAYHQQQNLQMTLQEEQQALLAKLPEWNDPAKAKQEKALIKEYLKGQGFTEGDIETIYDHRAVSVARKAMLFDQLMAKQPQAQAKAQKAPPRVERPGTGTRPADGRTQAMQQLTKTGNVKDAAQLMKAFL